MTEYSVHCISLKDFTSAALLDSSVADATPVRDFVRPQY